MDDSLFIKIHQLCELVHERGLQELSITQPGFTINLITAQSAPVLTVAPVTHAAPVTRSASLVEIVPEAPGGFAITTPIIGTFYRASSPDSPHFVEIGDMVEIGQTVGIVEAMKVFNEITSDIAGTVIAIPACNGQLVNVNEPLVILEPCN